LEDIGANCRSAAHDWHAVHSDIPATGVGPEPLAGCRTRVLERTRPVRAGCSEGGCRWLRHVSAGAADTRNGLLSMDANCRPAGFQVFVFADGIFAGTLSPMPMAARGDGTMFDVYLSRGEVNALFDRYLPTDGLCCPSAQTRVRFIIEWTTAGPVVTPVTAEHWSAPSPGR
jgi:hypothetical protein